MGIDSIKNIMNNSKSTEISSEVSKKKLIISIALRIIIICAVSVAVGFAFEAYVNRHLLKIDSSIEGVMNIDSTKLTLVGFKEDEAGNLIQIEDAASITINKPIAYLDKLIYNYDLHKDFNATIEVIYGYNTDGTPISKVITDTNNLTLDISATRINSNVESIVITFPDSAKGMVIDNISYSNVANVNVRRLFIVISIVFSIGLIVAIPRLFTEHIEYGFLVTALVMGVALITMLPSQKVAWDEEYHFIHSYNMSITGKVVEAPLVSYYGDDTAVSSLLYPQTSEEYASMNAYLDGENLYDNPEYETKASFELKDIGHIPSAIGIGIGRLFKQPLSVLYRLGRIFNLLAYVAITFFAIRHTKICKKIMTVIALLPTTVFLAATYSYDAVLIACAFLAAAYMFTVFADKESKMTWKTYGIIMVSMFVVCGIKMLYAPLLIALLFVPKDRFANSKTRIIMKSSIFVLFLAVMAIMLLPTLVSTSTGAEAAGDARGGSTSASGQLKYILSNPGGYTKLLLSSIVRNFADYTVGTSIYGWFAHLGPFSVSSIITVVVMFFAVTDTNEGITLTKWPRIIIGILSFGIICLIWTALYMSFTPVGMGEILGVQARYYMPIIIPMMTIVNLPQIRNSINTRIYNMIALIAPMAITYSMILAQMMIHCY